MAVVTQGVEPASALMAAAHPAWLDAWCGFAARIRFDHLPRRSQRGRGWCCWTASAPSPPARRSRRWPRWPGEWWRAKARGGAGDRAGPGRAARHGGLLNGTSGTMLELDEGNQYARGHPRSMSWPALLAAPRR
jgi:hypothetical protein